MLRAVNHSGPSLVLLGLWINRSRVVSQQRWRAVISTQFLVDPNNMTRAMWTNDIIHNCCWCMLSIVSYERIHRLIEPKLIRCYYPHYKYLWHSSLLLLEPITSDGYYSLAASPPRTGRSHHSVHCCILSNDARLRCCMWVSLPILLGSSYHQLRSGVAWRYCFV